MAASMLGKPFRPGACSPIPCPNNAWTLGSLKIAQCLTRSPSHDARVICERCGGIAIEPAALLLQRLRQVPMVEAEPRRDAVRDEPIDQAAVKVEPALLHRAAARRQNARPRG